MVNISFEPPLKVETRVKPAIQGDATINVTFYASLDYSEWQRLQKNGASIELWSDIPADGKPSGSWGATTFVKRDSEVSARGARPNYVTDYHPRGTKCSSKHL